MRIKYAVSFVRKKRYSISYAQNTNAKDYFSKQLGKSAQILLEHFLIAV